MPLVCMQCPVVHYHTQSVYMRNMAALLARHPRWTVRGKLTGHTSQGTDIISHTMCYDAGRGITISKVMLFISLTPNPITTIAIMLIY